MDLPDETVHHGSHRMNNTQKKQQMSPFLLFSIVNYARAPTCLYKRPQRRTGSRGVAGYCGVSKNRL